MESNAGNAGRKRGATIGSRVRRSYGTTRGSTAGSAFGSTVDRIGGRTSGKTGSVSDSTVRTICGRTEDGIENRTEGNLGGRLGRIRPDGSSSARTSGSRKRERKNGSSLSAGAGSIWAIGGGSCLFGVVLVFGWLVGVWVLASVFCGFCGLRK